MAKLLRWVGSDGYEVALDGTMGVTVLRGAKGLDCPPRQVVLEDRVVGSGANIVGDRTPVQDIQLPMHFDLQAADVPKAIASMRRGAGVLVAGSGRELRNVVYKSGLEGVWSVQTGGVEGLGFRQFPVEFQALDPPWYGPIQTVDLVLGDPTGWSDHIGWSPHIPWSGGGSQTIVVSGDEEAFPVWSLRGPLENFSVGLSNSRAWATVTALTGAGTPQDVLTVDHRVGSRGPKFGSSIIPGYAIQTVNWSHITEQSRVDWALPVGANSLVMGGTADDVGTLIRLAWEERWLSP